MLRWHCAVAPVAARWQHPPFPFPLLLMAFYVTARVNKCTFNDAVADD